MVLVESGKEAIGPNRASVCPDLFGEDELELCTIVCPNANLQ